MQDLAGRVAVVTGGASGIGKALAEAFVAEGMQVVVADIEADALLTTAQAIGAHPVVTDVSDRDSVQALADAVVAKYGTVDIVCNNAGVAVSGLFGEMTADDWRWSLDVNLWSVINGIDAFLPLLEQNPNGGHIVNTSSMVAFAPMAGSSVYNTTKYAILGLTESLRVELAEAGSRVGVSILCPGLVRTNLGTSERNRPARHGQAPAATTPREMPVAVLDQIVEPSAIAAQVVDAIRRDEFWIVTHPALFDSAIGRWQEIRQATLNEQGA